MRTMALKYLSITLVLAGLAGCSDAPEAADVQPLVEDSLRSGIVHARSMAETLGGADGVAFIESLGAPEPADVQVEHVQILDSRELDHGDYDLDVRYDVVVGDEREVVSRRLRLNETADGWRLVPAPSR
ncbi:hypothetical protein [Salinisphaera orenii]|uniref:hypothetical protein n=1 Tax=Salinisphaera orenii TaxID=856731 RepID=UPI000F4C3B06|nr:hypothetical protein [Salinisphaera orenii]